MKKKILETIFLISILIFSLPQLASAIQFEKCIECHGMITPISKPNLTKDCMMCHDQHGDPAPEKTSTNAHINHAGIRRVSDKNVCKDCHWPSSRECKTCHNSHENIGSIKIKLSSINTTICIDCHGELPQPYGHSNFRDALSDSKHKWMNCGTCHISINRDNNSFGFGLHFKNLFEISILDSIDLCKICHNTQYKGLKANTHGAPDKICIDCHNPHTTKFSGPQVQVTPEEAPENASVKIQSTIGWITAKVPILNNPIAVFILLIVIVVTISEYVLTRQEEGQKTSYNMVKIIANEDILKTLEIKLKDQDINSINNILLKNNVNTLGMTMTKEESKDGNLTLYKYVIFVETEESKEKDLIDELSSMSNVKTVEFTEKYEL